MVNHFKYGTFSKSRVEAFSDGVFAIIVTLLVLEIRVPHVEHVASGRALLDALYLMMPKLVSWLISFITLCIVWVNHHRILEMFKGINIQLFWHNVHMLLWVCFVPFPTALIGDYPRNPLAVASYGVVMFFAGTAFVLTRYYGYRNKGMLKDDVSIPTFRKGMIFAFVFGPVLYLAAAGLAWVNPAISFLMYFLIAMYFAFSFVIVHAGDRVSASK